MKKGIAVLSRLAGGLILLIGTASAAAAQQCWRCDRDGEYPYYVYRCVQEFGPGGFITCSDMGGGSGQPCEMSGFCDPMLRAMVATVRPDGIMTPAIGLSQLVPSSWLQAIKSFGLVQSDHFPNLTVGNETAAKRRTDDPIRLFSALFAAPPNAGVTSGGKCEGYLGTRSYTTEEAAILRREAAILRI